MDNGEETAPAAAHLVLLWLGDKACTMHIRKARLRIRDDKKKQIFQRISIAGGKYYSQNLQSLEICSKTKKASLLECTSQKSLRVEFDSLAGCSPPCCCAEPIKKKRKKKEIIKWKRKRFSKQSSSCKIVVLTLPRRLALASPGTLTGRAIHHLYTSTVQLEGSKNERMKHETKSIPSRHHHTSGQWSGEASSLLAEPSNELCIFFIALFFWGGSSSVPAKPRVLLNVSKQLS